MSVAKLLSRIVAPDALDTDVDGDGRILASAMHDHTYGITSDPLTQFSCVFAALIHDADHDGGELNFFIMSRFLHDSYSYHTC